MKSFEKDKVMLQTLIDYFREGEAKLVEMIESFRSDQRYFLGVQNSTVNPNELYQTKLNLMYCDIVLYSLDNASHNLYNLTHSLRELQNNIKRISTPPTQ